MNPEEDVATFLAAAGLGLTLGANLFTGPVLAVGTGVPASAVFCINAPAERPEPFAGSGTSTYAADVEVTIRGAPDARGPARALAASIIEALQMATLSGYHLVLVVDSVPEYVKKDQQGCHEYAVAVTVEWVS